jgi:AcrR family transcriptional regulator
LAEELVEAAAELFDRKGFANTSVQDVAESAGVTKGGFYHHFRSKDDLLFEIHDRFIDWQLQGAAAIVAQGLPPAQTVQALVEELMVAVDLYRSWIGTFIRERRYITGHHRFDEVKQKRDALSDTLIKVIEDGIKSGEFRELSDSEVKVLAFGIIGMTAWAVEWYARRDGMSAVEIGQTYARTLLSGLKRPDASTG